MELCHVVTTAETFSETIVLPCDPVHQILRIGTLTSQSQCANSKNQHGPEKTRESNWIGRSTNCWFPSHLCAFVQTWWQEQSWCNLCRSDDGMTFSIRPWTVKVLKCAQCGTCVCLRTTTTAGLKKVRLEAGLCVTLHLLPELSEGYLYPCQKKLHTHHRKRGSVIIAPSSFFCDRDFKTCTLDTEEKTRSRYDRQYI